MTADKQAPASESVLARWSRRKREAEQQPAPVEAVEQASTEELEAQPPLTDADMPNLDSLTAESDFSPFMSSGVSDELRNLALRKLFRAPVFNIRDGLDEYDEDFTTFEKLGGIVTADMKHRVEMEQRKLREALAREDESSVDDGAESVEARADEDGADIEIAELDDARRSDVAPGSVDAARKPDGGDE